MTTVDCFDLTTAADARGLLSACQYPGSLPFAPVRVFIVTHSPSGTERGGHAHRQCHQVIVVTAGNVLVEYDDDAGTHQVQLGDATRALYIPPLAWAKQTYLTEGASLVVLASHPYDVDDYIDDRHLASQLRAEAAN